jgi:hypothetical protein
MFAETLAVEICYKQVTTGMLGLPVGLVKLRHCSDYS